MRNNLKRIMSYFGLSIGLVIGLYDVHSMRSSLTPTTAVSLYSLDPSETPAFYLFLEKYFQDKTRELPLFMAIAAINSSVCGNVLSYWTVGGGIIALESGFTNEHVAGLHFVTEKLSGVEVVARFSAADIAPLMALTLVTHFDQVTQIFQDDLPLLVRILAFDQHLCVKYGFVEEVLDAADTADITAALVTCGPGPLLSEVLSYHVKPTELFADIDATAEIFREMLVLNRELITSSLSLVKDKIPDGTIISAITAKPNPDFIIFACTATQNILVQLVLDNPAIKELPFVKDFVLAEGFAKFFVDIFSESSEKPSNALQIAKQIYEKGFTQAALASIAMIHKGKLCKLLGIDAKSSPQQVAGKLKEYSGAFLKSVDDTIKLLPPEQLIGHYQSLARAFVSNPQLIRDNKDRLIEIFAPELLAHMLEANHELIPRVFIPPLIAKAFLSNPDLIGRIFPLRQFVKDMIRIKPELIPQLLTPPLIARACLRNPALIAQFVGRVFIPKNQDIVAEAFASDVTLAKAVCAIPLFQKEFVQTLALPDARPLLPALFERVCLVPELAGRMGSLPRLPAEVEAFSANPSEKAQKLCERELASPEAVSFTPVITTLFEDTTSFEQMFTLDSAMISVMQRLITAPTVDSSHDFYTMNIVTRFLRCLQKYLHYAFETSGGRGMEVVAKFTRSGLAVKNPKCVGNAEGFRQATAFIDRFLQGPCNPNIIYLFQALRGTGCNQAAIEALTASKLLPLLEHSIILEYLKHSMHTEVQISVLARLNPFYSVKPMSLILSLNDPCWSCCQLAVVHRAVPGSYLFVSTKQDRVKKAPKFSRTCLLKFQLPEPAPVLAFLVQVLFED
jgi:hypothetical protein